MSYLTWVTLFRAEIGHIRYYSDAGHTPTILQSGLAMLEETNRPTMWFRVSLTVSVNVVTEFNCGQSISQSDPCNEPSVKTLNMRAFRWASQVGSMPRILSYINDRKITHPEDIGSFAFGTCPDLAQGSLSFTDLIFILFL